MSMTLKTERFEMRLETTMIERVDAWRRKQEDLPSRAEAFRRLIEMGLSAKKTGAKVKT
jgi:metal-responsive CopG/Arc/MetJ family transcriptional regulator